jgi:hypothetical protein
MQLKLMAGIKPHFFVRVFFTKGCVLVFKAGSGSVMLGQRAFNRYWKNRKRMNIGLPKFLSKVAGGDIEKNSNFLSFFSFFLLDLHYVYHLCMIILCKKSCQYP